jgi:hypothetical protein
MTDAPPEEPETKTASTREIAEALHALKRELHTAVREGVVLANIQVDRARIWARESAWTIGLVIVEVIAILVLLVAATLAFASGLCGAFGAFFKSGWAGSLVGGAIGIAIAVGLLIWAKHRMAVAGRKRLRAKYDPEPPLE